MKKTQALTAWKLVLEGRRPFLSIDITSACPLHCPGCYAFAPSPNGNGTRQRAVRDLRGDDLVEGVLELVRKLRPLHLSLVGGEPLIRLRELEVLLPRLAPLEVQVVTSAVSPIPAAWAEQDHIHLAVSVDGLPPEHDRRRAPATYERILRNIAGHRVIIHCTVTRQMMRRPGYLREFAAYWSGRPEARKIWFSLFTPRVNIESEERLGPEERKRAIAELAALAPLFPKVHMPKLVLDGYAQPPTHPGECLFAEMTTCIAADLKTEIGPCELGEGADCRECGCLAAAGLGAVGRYRLANFVPVGGIVRLSKQIGEARRRRRNGKER